MPSPPPLLTRLVPSLPLPPLSRPQLACLVAVPLLALSFYIILQSGAGGDGVLGKEAYEAAANVADETLGSMTTVAAFNGEIKAAARYEGNLGTAEEAAIRQVRASPGGKGDRGVRRGTSARGRRRGVFEGRVVVTSQRGSWLGVVVVAAPMLSGS